MAILPVSGVVQRVSEAIAELDGWTESAYPYDLFAINVAEPSHFAHQAFAIGAPETVFDSEIESSVRKRGADGGLVATTVGVRWMYRVRSDDYVVTYKEMLDAEALLIRKIIDARVTDLHIAVDRMQRRILSTEACDWSLGEIRLGTTHRVPIW